jgi:hypothetical protein
MHPRFEYFKGADHEQVQTNDCEPYAQHRPTY